MTDIVKQFIQENKDLIASNNWQTMFEAWMYSVTKKVYPDTEYFSEFIDVLQTAKIPVDFDARKNVLVEFIVDSINVVLDNRDDWNGNNIPYHYLVSEPYSLLGYTKEEITSFIPDAVAEMNGEVIIDAENERLLFA